MTLLNIKHLNLTFKTSDGDVQALNNLSFSVKPGIIYGIAGESGSGKTQSMMSLLGLLDDNAIISGSIEFNGNNLIGLSESELNSYRSRHISIVFQDPMTSLNPFLPIEDQLTEVLIIHKKFTKSRAIKKAIDMCKMVKLPDPESLIKRYPHELSGGMRQRVCIAMACLCEPELLIADEATTSLDVINQSEILSLLNELKVILNTTILLITHDLAVISKYCDEVLIMRNGCLVESGSTQSVFNSPKENYTKMLLNTVPTLNQKKPVFPNKKNKNSESEILAVKNCSVEYRTKISFFKKSTKTRALNNISFKLFKNQILGIVGESGCGKSTLAKVLKQLVKTTSGYVDYMNCNVKKDIQIIFQDPLASLNPRMTILECISEPLSVLEPGIPKEDKIQRVLALLEKVGLNNDHLNRYPHEFSGGQCQRIGIARSLIAKPKILICDEPVSALDVTIQAKILQLLLKLKKDYDLTIIFISHDLSVISQICDYVMVMYHGEIIESNHTSKIFSMPKHGYTKKLIKAIPVLKKS